MTLYIFYHESAACVLSNWKYKLWYFWEDQQVGGVKRITNLRHSHWKGCIFLFSFSYFYGRKPWRWKTWTTQYLRRKFRASLETLPRMRSWNWESRGKNPTSGCWRTPPHTLLMWIPKVGYYTLNSGLTGNHCADKTLSASSPWKCLPMTRRSAWLKLRYRT